MARVLAAERRGPEAASLLQQVLRQCPNFLNAYVDLADIYLRENQPAQAIQTLRAGLKKTPNDPVMLNDLAIAYLGARQPAEALEVARQAAARAAAATQSACPPRYLTNVALCLASSAATMMPWVRMNV